MVTVVDNPTNLNQFGVEVIGAVQSQPETGLNPVTQFALEVIEAVVVHLSLDTHGTMFGPDLK